MKKLIATAFLLGGIAVAAAGARSAYNVYIDGSSRVAYGSIGKVRNSADNYQYIGCSTVTIVGFGYMTCWARDSTGTLYASCYTEDPGMIAAGRSLPSDGYLKFTWSAGSNDCSNINVYNASYYEPKQ